jgi:hypothetical protein
MYRTFSESIVNNGRIYEFGFMFKYYLQTNPLAALKMLPTALKLLVHRRLPLTPKRVKGKADLRIIIDKLSAGVGK